MSRRPEETAEQWYSRSAATCEEAVEALEVESTRLGLGQWRFLQPRQRLDVRYRAAMD